MITHQQQDLNIQYEKYVKKARDLKQPILVSHVFNINTIDPLSFFYAGGSPYKGQRMYWSAPTNDDIECVGLGIETSLESLGAHRYTAIQKQWSELIQNAHIHNNTSERNVVGPTLLGGFSFDPEQRPTEEWALYPDSFFMLPKIMVTNVKGKSYMTVNKIVHPHTEQEEVDDEQLRLSEKIDQLLNDSTQMSLIPNKDEYPAQLNIIDEHEGPWLEAVEETANKIRHGELEKAVLARKVTVTANDDFSIHTIISHLRAEQKGTYIYAVERGQSCFVGASPERLVKKEGKHLSSTCLAGSIKRGLTNAEDSQLADELFLDKKNRIEHDLVVQMIKKAMKDVCTDVVIQDKPVVFKTTNIQHLYTPVEGTLSRVSSLFSIVEALHPTPALGGMPRDKAMQTIRRCEWFDRGWYASPVGWLNHDGDGEFCVAIRSGLIRGHEAYLYAGCGIVGDSNPQQEFEETRIKLQPMLSALGGRKDADR